MNSTAESPPTCTVCGGYDDDTHKERQHPFTGPDQPEWIPPKDKLSKAQQKKAGEARPSMVVMPQPDLALRSLLVAKGLINDDELKEAENALRFPRHSDPVLPDRGHTG